MKVGDLVNITRRAVGVPAGTFGLITDIVKGRGDTTRNLQYCLVEMYGHQHVQGITRRWLGRDLELMNG